MLPNTVTSCIRSVFGVFGANLMAEKKNEKVCGHFLSSNAPTFSNLGDFYAADRTCYSTVPPPVDERRDGKWH